MRLNSVSVLLTHSLAVVASIVLYVLYMLMLLSGQRHDQVLSCVWQAPRLAMYPVARVYQYKRYRFTDTAIRSGYEDDLR